MSLSSVIGTTLLIGDNSVTSFGSVDPNISIRSDKNMKIHDVYAYLAGLPEKCVDNIIMVMGSNDCDSHSDVNRIMTEYRNVINVARRVCSSHIYTCGLDRKYRVLVSVVCLSVCVSVCLSVCLCVSTITQKINGLGS